MGGVQNHVCLQILLAALWVSRRISGLVVEYIVAIDVTRARFLADALGVEKTRGTLRVTGQNRFESF